MNTVIVKKFEILRELPNCDAGTTKQVDAIGKMVPTDQLDAGLLQTFSLQKAQHLRSPSMTQSHPGPAGGGGGHQRADALFSGRPPHEGLFLPVPTVPALLPGHTAGRRGISGVSVLRCR